MKYIIYAVSWTVVALAFIKCSRREVADLVIYGGPIYTMNEKSPKVEALAVKGNKIVFVGSKSEALERVGETTRVIDLKGKTLTPGLVDGHAHLIEMALRTMHIDLSKARSFEEIIAKVSEAAKQAKPGEWIVGDGWHQEKWENKPSATFRGFPVHHELSKLTPENPVYLRHASGHAGFANAKAMELIGVSPLKREGREIKVEGGEIFRDSNGFPTGLFNENALTLIEQKISVSDDELERGIEKVMDLCLQNGITGFHDAGESERYLNLIKRFRQQNKLRIRLYVMLAGSDTALVTKYLKQGIEIDPDHWLTIRAIKYYSDGALGSRGAWLLQPYSDSPETSGTVTLPMDSLYHMCDKAFAAGFQVCTHAIGDRANREVLNQYEKVFSRNPSEGKNRRFRIEHAQHLDPKDIGRFSALGVLPAVQAIHMSSDRPWAIDRLGEQRILDGAYVWQSLLKSGAVVINGTDAPVEPINPLECYYASVTRKTLKEEPKNGYEPRQKMTREQALRSYTFAPAYGSFEENVKGSIEVGKLADFTVLSEDILTIPEERILKTTVVMTIVDGKVAFER